MKLKRNKFDIVSKVQVLTMCSFINFCINIEVDPEAFTDLLLLPIKIGKTRNSKICCYSKSKKEMVVSEQYVEGTKDEKAKEITIAENVIYEVLCLINEVNHDEELLKLSKIIVATRNDRDIDFDKFEIEKENAKKMLRN